MKKRAWHWLLLIPFAAELWPPLYSHADPAFYGIPFFYWYQLLWVVITSLLIGFVMLMTRERDDA